MEQPGWRGKLRVAFLYFSGVIVGALGSGICEGKYAVGSSAATYALIMAHLGKGRFLCFFDPPSPPNPILSDFSTCTYFMMSDFDPQTPRPPKTF